MKLSDAVICFDLGGVLLEIIHDLEERIEVCRSPERSLRLSDSTKRELIADNLEYQRGRLSRDDYMALLVSKTAGSGFTHDDWERIEQGIILGPMPDAEDMVSFFRERAKDLGVLSNTCEMHVQQFQSYSFFDQIPESSIVYSHRDKVLKPEPEAFTCFEERLGCRPDEVVLFDDTRENISAAHQAGWKAFQIVRGIPVFPQVQGALSLLTRGH